MIKVHDIKFPAKSVKVIEGKSTLDVNVTIGKENMMEFLNAIMSDDLVNSFMHSPPVKRYLADVIVGRDIMRQARKKKKR